MYAARQQGSLVRRTRNRACCLLGLRKFPFPRSFYRIDKGQLMSSTWPLFGHESLRRGEISGLTVT